MIENGKKRVTEDEKRLQRQIEELKEKLKNNEE
jgi:hypothetical protein